MKLGLLLIFLSLSLGAQTQQQLLLGSGQTSTASGAPPVQSGTSGGSGGSTQNTQNFTQNAVIGHFMVFAVYNQTNAITTITSVTSSCGTAVATPLSASTGRVSGTTQAWIYYMPVVSGPCGGVVFNFSGSVNTTVIYAEYAGMAASSQFDCEPILASGIGVGSGNLNSGTCTTSNAKDLLFAGLFTTGVSGSFIAGSGYTMEVTNSGSTDRAAEDQNVSATGTYSATATMASGTWIAYLVAFKRL